MYEIHCESCGDIGIHLSRTGAETAARLHVDGTGHDCSIDVVTDVPGANN